MSQALVHRILTQRKSDIITHSIQLSKTNDFVFRGNSNFFHSMDKWNQKVLRSNYVLETEESATVYSDEQNVLFYGKSNSIFIVRGDHHIHFVRNVSLLLQFLYSIQTFGECTVVHLSCSIIIWIYWISIVESLGSSPFLQQFTKHSSLFFWQPL